VYDSTELNSSVSSKLKVQNSKQFKMSKTQNSKPHRLLKSFLHALEGIAFVFSEHPNFKIHIIISVIAIFAGLLLNFSSIEFLILILTILIVLIAEMANTAVEEVTNLVTVKWARQAKLAKDISAGMVLVSAIGSIVIGMLLFLPKLF
jgi:diacylglycerol kinase